MDEMKIGSKFMKNLVSKLVKSEVKKRVGYEVDIQLNELDAAFDGGKAHIHLSVDAELSKEELTKILKTVVL
ncbi:CTP synthase [Lachnospiraceae bacterium 29-84]